MSNNTTADLDDMSSLITSSSAIDSKKKKEFDQKREKILSSIPNDVKRRFGTIHVASFSKLLGPVLILSPYSPCLASRTRVRDKWFKMFHNVSTTSYVLHHDVFYCYTVLYRTYSSS